MIKRDFAPRLVAIFFFILSSQDVLAETRIALVIGNGAYDDAPLDNPPRDADLMADVLFSLDFEVTNEKDVDQKSMKRPIAAFGDRLRKASDAIGFFYFSGHGMQVGGRNYMIPIDAVINDESDVEVDGVLAWSVLSRMEHANGVMNIVVLDACRNNPFEKRFKSAQEGVGLAPMQAPAGALIAYATAPGDVADPGPRGEYSPFTAALASELRASSASVLELFNSVSTKVYNDTGRDQRPYLESSVVPVFAFRQPGSSDIVPSRIQPTVGVYPEALAAGTVFRDCPECPEMVVVPAGKFMMGSPPDEPGRDDADEGPQHEVTIPRPFAVGKYEVTRSEFAAFVDASGYGPSGGCFVYTNGEWQEDSGKNRRDPGYEQSDQHPMTCVSWEDAQAYVRWLGGEAGKDYRLLSEAEWEYAARAESKMARFWGNDANLACNFANVHDDTSKRVNGFPWENHTCDDGFAHTASVGSFDANDLGLHDMLGNVWEWSEDCWHSNYDDAPRDGSAWTTGGDCRRRVFRGGSWNNGPRNVRSAYRGGFNPDNRDFADGFRVARTID